MCDFDGVRRGNYFGGEPIRRAEVEVGVEKLKNGNTAGKDEITGEMIKVRADKMVNLVWRMCNISFESGVVPKDWIFSVIIPLYKGKRED